MTLGIKRLKQRKEQAFLTQRSETTEI